MSFWKPWRAISEDPRRDERAALRVQMELKDEAAHTNYSLSSSLESFKLIYCVPHTFAQVSINHRIYS